jgi:hypothetical protein
MGREQGKGREGRKEEEDDLAPPQKKLLQIATVLRFRSV